MLVPSELFQQTAVNTIRTVSMNVIVISPDGNIVFVEKVRFKVIHVVIFQPIRFIQVIIKSWFMSIILSQ